MYKFTYIDNFTFLNVDIYVYIYIYILQNINPYIYTHIDISQAPQTLTVQCRSVNARIRDIQKLDKTNSENTE